MEDNNVLTNSIVCSEYQSILTPFILLFSHLIKTKVETWPRDLERVNEKYVLQGDIAVESLADRFTITIEGGILLARNFEDNQLLIDQIIACRSFIRSLYGAN